MPKVKNVSKDEQMAALEGHIAELNARLSHQEKTIIYLCGKIEGMEGKKIKDEIKNKIEAGFFKDKIWKDGKWENWEINKG